jgi:hypothetical protein
MSEEWTVKRILMVVIDNQLEMMLALADAIGSPRQGLLDCQKRTAEILRTLIKLDDMADGG